MAHIKIIKGLPYLYESFRRGGRVCKRCIGRVRPEHLELARAVCEAERMERAERVQARQEAARERQERHRQAGALLGEIDANLLRPLRRHVMQATGERKALVPAERPPQAIAPAERPPRALAIPREEGPLMEAVRGQLVRLAGGAGDTPEDRAARRDLAKELRDKERELAGSDPSAVEAAIAESAALSWFMCRWLQVELNEMVSRGAITAAGEIESREKRIGRAHRQYMDALALLEKIRKPAGNVVVQLASFGPRGKGPRRMTGRESIEVRPVAGGELPPPEDRGA